MRRVGRVRRSYGWQPLPPRPHVIRRLRSRAEEWREEELARLLNRLGPIDDRMAEEIRRSFERLVNKLLHPPLESLRDDAQRGAAGGLLDALKRLFRLDE